MRNVLQIIRSDIRGMFSSVVLIIICIGLCVLPALYAWFNIYSNWDPYANTKGIKMAVVCLDEGYTTEDGELVNAGENVVDNLKENNSIGWVFPESKDEAVEGVYAGDYYGAVIMDKDFTYNMYNVFNGELNNSVIEYYENEKKNAVATKITDTAVQTLTNTINEEFIQIAAKAVFDETNEIASDLENKSEILSLEDTIRNIGEQLTKYDEDLNDFIESEGELKGDIEEAKGRLPVISSRVLNSTNSLNSVRDKLGDLESDLLNVDESAGNIFRQIGSIVDEIDELMQTIMADGREDRIKEAIDRVLEFSGRLENRLTGLENLLERIRTYIGGGSAALNRVISGVQQMKDDIAVFEDALAKVDIDKAQAAIDKVQGVLDEVSVIYDDNILPWVSLAIDNIYSTIDDAAALLGSTEQIVDNAGGLFDGAASTADGANASLKQLQSVIQLLNSKIQKGLNKIDEAEGNEKVAAIIELLNGDGESYGKFLANPVKMNTHSVYPVENYGSSMAPFYTVLALWVGALILIAIIKVKADSTHLINPRPAELFFGRYLVFFVMGQVQALIVVLGDLYLLKIQCIHPFKFWLVAALASLTFNLIIYALTISFGDIGKALAVVVMVIQIAGSGGTFPVELLPDTFRYIYVFFPFPYAIDAMRETIGGMYGAYYYKYLAQLLLFAIAALVIGLVIRKPFIKLNRFVEKRMDDTKMM